MPVLIVVAHPDDEVLGCAGTAAKLAAHGCEVRACILSSNAEARQNRPETQEFMEDMKNAQLMLGLKEPILGNFPNIQFNTVPHLKLVQFIEQALDQTKADLVFTHHPDDLNNDHVQTSQACQAAARLFQRRPEIPRLRGLYFIEILSSTDWAFPASSGQFMADTFFEIGEEYLERKIKALRAYRGVMRDFPHPRSDNVLRSLAAYRGGQAGMKYAEAFQTAYHSLSVSEFQH